MSREQERIISEFNQYTETAFNMARIFNRNKVFDHWMDASLNLQIHVNCIQLEYINTMFSNLEHLKTVDDCDIYIDKLTGIMIFGIIGKGVFSIGYLQKSYLINDNENIILIAGVSAFYKNGNSFFTTVYKRSDIVTQSEFVENLFIN